MRKIFLLMNVSLNGYFEAPGHDISWATDDFEAFSRGQSGEVDTFLFGHRTYEMMKFWGTPQAQQMQPEVAKVMNERPKLVASHAPFEPGWQNVTVISGDVVGQVKTLKEQPGGTIAIFGSNTLCVSLMPEGLIDEFQIIVNPVALEAGTPLFQGLAEKAKLTLVESVQFKAGTVLLTYKPAQ
jgi:dihydrofolate reductase